MTRSELAEKYLRMSEGDDTNWDYLILAAQMADFDTYLKYASQFPETDKRSCTCRPNEGPLHVHDCPRRAYWDKHFGRRFSSYYGSSA
jgi:hypothetical protein